MNLEDQELTKELPKPVSPEDEKVYIAARRTAFVARFIILRETKKTNAHREIEMMEWSEDTTAEELAERFLKVFEQNGDGLKVVRRDINRAMEHTNRSIKFFLQEYATRSTTNFIDALYDYDQSNALLFGDGEGEPTGGWKLPQHLEEIKKQLESESHNV